MLDAPDAHDHIGAGGHDQHEGEGVAGGRQPVPEPEPDRDHGENDSGVEELAVPLRPRLEIAAALAPDEEQEERDGEEERDLKNPADRRDDRLEREQTTTIAITATIPSPRASEGMRSQSLLMTPS